MDHYFPINRLVQSYLASTNLYGDAISGLHPTFFWVWRSHKGEIKKSKVLCFINISLDHERDKKTCVKMVFRA